MKINYNKLKVIFTWIIVALSAFFIFGTLAAIKRWIDRSWAEGIAEYSVILIFVLGAALIVCFLLDRPDDEKKEKEQAESEEDPFDLDDLEPDSAGSSTDLEDLEPDFAESSTDLEDLEPDFAESSTDLEDLEPDFSESSTDLDDLESDSAGSSPDLDDPESDFNKLDIDEL
ncbi:MAG: hypothetical protein QF408_07525 [Pirellulales bacterium]|jgi:hypothetical protein|nr:hypothetical protein [Pirellulales bacterium]